MCFDVYMPFIKYKNIYIYLFSPVLITESAIVITIKCDVVVVMHSPRPQWLSIQSNQSEICHGKSTHSN